MRYNMIFATETLPSAPPPPPQQFPLLGTDLHHQQVWECSPNKQEQVLEYQTSVPLTDNPSSAQSDFHVGYNPTCHQQGFQSCAPPNQAYAQASHLVADTMPLVHKIEDLQLINMADVSKEELITSVINFIETHCVGLKGEELKDFVKRLGLTSDAQKEHLISVSGAKSLDKCKEGYCANVMVAALKLWEQYPLLGNQYLDEAMSGLPKHVYSGQMHVLRAFVVRPDSQELIHLREEKNRLEAWLKYYQVENTHYIGENQRVNAQLLQLKSTMENSIVDLETEKSKVHALEVHVKASEPKAQSLEEQLAKLTICTPSVDTIQGDGIIITGGSFTNSTINVGQKTKPEPLILTSAEKIALASHPKQYLLLKIVSNYHEKCIEYARILNPTFRTFIRLKNN